MSDKSILITNMLRLFSISYEEILNKNRYLSYLKSAELARHIIPEPLFGVKADAANGGMMRIVLFFAKLEARYKPRV